MKLTPSLFLKVTCVTFLAALLTTVSSHAQTIVFSGSAGLDGNGNYDYNTAGNWVGGLLPNLGAGGATALINDGLDVTYYGGGDGGDFNIGSGSTLEISNGSWTQKVNNSWIQLHGNSTIRVDGGTFNQGTESNNPFNLNGSTGNQFAISSGTAIFTDNTVIDSGLIYSQTGGVTNFFAGAALVLQNSGTYTQSGGVANVGGNLVLNPNGTGQFLLTGGTLNVTAGHEFDWDSSTSSMTGGVLNAPLMTGVNGGANHFDFSGGIVNLTGNAYDGIYGGGTTQYFNFTLNSTGVLNFTDPGDTIGNVDAFITSGVIEYQGTVDTSLTDFNVTQSGGAISVALITPAPEPSVFASVAVGAAALLSFRRRRR